MSRTCEAAIETGSTATNASSEYNAAISSLELPSSASGRKVMAAGR